MRWCALVVISRAPPVSVRAFVPFSASYILPFPLPHYPKPSVCKAYLDSLGSFLEDLDELAAEEMEADPSGNFEDKVRATLPSLLLLLLSLVIVLEVVGDDQVGVSVEGVVVVVLGGHHDHRFLFVLFILLLPRVFHCEPDCS